MRVDKSDAVFFLEAKTGIKVVAVTLFLIVCSWWMSLLSLGVDSANLYSGEIHQIFYFEPYLSKWLAGFLFSILGSAGLSFLGLVAIPISIFFILFSVFRRHLHPEWALFLALLSISVFEGYPLRAFLSDLIFMNFENIGSDKLPTLSGFPIPSVPMLLFVAVFWLATSNWLAFPSITRTIVVTILVSVFAYVSPIDLVLAAAFWAIYVPVRWFRAGWKLKFIAFGCLLHAVIAACIILPALLMGQIDPTLPRNEDLELYSLFAYFIVPLCMTVALIIVQKVDPQELLFSFGHVFALMLAEFSVLLTASFGLFPIDLDIFQNRSPQFFAHALYYMPVIYLASRTAFPTTVGSESLPASVFVRKALSAFFVKLRPFVTGVLVLVLLSYNLVCSLTFISRI